ncbi:unnamed protein product [Rotaria sp. Silwood1]|nr:unnamed protein product [Rotaria sp. Silwood1]CAF1634245.1 unnamed protein product [Rotaria sp. Silwood1]
MERHRIILKEKLNDEISEDVLKSQELSSLLSESTLYSEPINLDSKLVQLCLQIPKPELDDESDKDIHILWLRSEENKLSNKSESLNGLEIKKYYSFDELIRFIKTLETKNVFLIIDQSLVLNNLSSFDDLAQIIFIYILENEEINDYIPITNSKRSIRKISNNKEELFYAINEDIYISTKDFLCTSILDISVEEESTNQTKNLSFIWYHLLINSLFDLTVYNKTAKNDLIKYSRKQYSDNIAQQNKITKFENEYLSTEAIQWYTRDSFVFRLFNKALRTRDIISIFKFRFFIIDLQKQLEQLYDEEIMQYLSLVYRGQKISSLEFNKLEKSIGKYISVNTYFSASMSEDVALIYASDPLSSVILEIEMENVVYMKNKRTRPVYIGHISDHPDELEAIFPIGSTFKIHSIREKNNKRYLKLILETDDHYEQLFDIFQKNYINKLPSTIKFAELLIWMGEYDKAQEYLQILIKDLKLSSDNIKKGYVYDYMGQISYIKGDYKSALSRYNKALNFISIDEIYCANIYCNIANLYYAKNEYNQALEYYKKSLNYKQDMDPLDLASLYESFGNVYSRIHEFGDAVTFLNEALDIRHSNQLSHHGYLSTYTALMILYSEKSDYNKALQCLKELLNILLKTVSKNHPQFIAVYTFIGQMYIRCNDYESAMIYCQKSKNMIDIILIKEISLNPIQYILLYTTLAEIYDYNDDMENLFYFANKAVNIYNKFINSIPKAHPIIENIHNMLAIAYYKKNDFKSALDIYRKTSTFSDEVNSKLMRLVNSATIYIGQDNPKTALEYLDQSFELSSKINQSIINYKILSLMNDQYSRAYKLNNNLKKAIFYAEEALQLCEVHKDSRQIASTLLYLSNLCPDKKKIYMEKILEILQQDDLPLMDTYIYHYLYGLYCKHQMNYSNALHHLQISLKYQSKMIPRCHLESIFTIYNIVSIHKKNVGGFTKNELLSYLEKCDQIYVELLKFKEIPYRDMVIMFWAEKYFVDNIKQCSLLISVMFLIYFEIGKIYIEANNRELALDYIQKAEQILNDYIGKKEIRKKDYIYYLLASSYHSVENPDKALLYYEKRVQSLPFDYNQYGFCYYLMSEIYYDKNDYFMSISKCKIALTFLHNSPSMNYIFIYLAYWCTSLAYSNIKNNAYAFIYGEQSLKYCLLQNPIDYDKFILNYTHCTNYLWKSKLWNVEKPLNYILEAVELTQYSLTDETLLRLYYRVGLFYFINEKYEDALVSYNKSLEYSKISDPLMMNCTYRQIWIVYIMMGEFNKAYDIVKKTIDSIVNVEGINLFLISQLYIDMGITHYRFGEYQLALQCYRKAFHFLENDQNNRTHELYNLIYNYIGLLYFEYGHIVDAMNYCIKSRNIIYSCNDESISPINTYISLGLVECKLKNYSNALNYFGQAWEFIYNTHIQYHPAHKILYNHIGYVYFKLGHIHIAMKNYLKTLSMYRIYPKHPDLAQVYKNIGLIFEQDVHNYPIALSFYKRALELIPNNKHPHYILYKNMIKTLQLKMKKKTDDKKKK